MTSPRKILSILSGIPFNFMEIIDKQRIFSYCNHNDMQYLHELNSAMGGGLIPDCPEDLNQKQLLFINLATTVDDKELLTKIFNFALLYKGLSDTSTEVKQPHNKVMQMAEIKPFCMKLLKKIDTGNGCYVLSINNTAIDYFIDNQFDFEKFRESANKLGVWEDFMEILKG